MITTIWNDGPAVRAAWLTLVSTTFAFLAAVVFGDDAPNLLAGAAVGFLTGAALIFLRPAMPRTLFVRA